MSLATTAGARRPPRTRSAASRCRSPECGGSPMNADLAALLDHCRRNPDDETRLILADWLEEQGDALGQMRARMIRAEIHLRPLREWSKEARALREEINTL